MNICPICGKRIMTPMQGTIIASMTGLNGTREYPCQIVFGDACMGHTITTITTTGTVPLVTPLRPLPLSKREPVPTAFQDAFDEDLHP